jgi:hypothetical protein
MGWKAWQRKLVRVQSAEQFAKANLRIQPVADLAPTDLAEAKGSQKSGIDFCVHGLFLI